jgi:hypothetical protein
MNITEDRGRKGFIDDSNINLDQEIVKLAQNEARTYAYEGVLTILSLDDFIAECHNFGLDIDEQTAYELYNKYNKIFNDIIDNYKIEADYDRDIFDEEFDILDTEEADM